MRHFIHKPSPTGKYKSILLIKESSFIQKEIEKAYILPLIELGYDSHYIFSMTLKYNEHGKAPAKFMQAYLKQVLSAAENREVTTLLVADAGYFKQLTKERKAEPHYGYVKPCAIPGYEHMKVILTVNYQALFYKPDLQQKLDRSLDAMVKDLEGFHVEPGTGIIHAAYNCTDTYTLRSRLKALHQYPVLTVDIETRGLDLTIGMLGTIAFAWDEHNGTVFNVSLHQGPHTQNIFRAALRNFFEKYKGKCIYHGATFDIKVLVFELFMSNWQDKSGMMKGLEIMTRNVDCTKIITYLATNTTSGNTLDLKSNAAEFAGNYAQDEIHDITKIPLPDLMEYNLIDCLSTWFVYNKYWQKMVDEEQLNVYNTILQPSIKLVCQMELVGMPLDDNEVMLADHKLSEELRHVKARLTTSQIIIDYTKRLKLEALIKKNKSLKKKQYTEDEFHHEGFNPNSNQQVAHLLHDVLKMDIIDLTPTKQPSVGGDTLKKHLNQLKSKFNLTDEDFK